ncbi:MAG: hypothetical protein SFV15_14785 [Polyangiaceae bacterium]|nr:hypothetical protein [Polyangiaceae bacterium]
MAAIERSPSAALSGCRLRELFGTESLTGVYRVRDLELLSSSQGERPQNWGDLG